MAIHLGQSNRLQVCITLGLGAYMHFHSYTWSISPCMDFYTHTKVRLWILPPQNTEHAVQGLCSQLKSKEVKTHYSFVACFKFAKLIATSTAIDFNLNYYTHCVVLTPWSWKLLSDGSNIPAPVYYNKRLLCESIFNLILKYKTPVDNITRESYTLRVRKNHPNMSRYKRECKYLINWNVLAYSAMCCA